MKLTQNSFIMWLVLIIVTGTLCNANGSCTVCSSPNNGGCSCCDCFGCSDCTDCCSFCTPHNFCYSGKTWFSQRDQGSNEYWVMSLTADKRHKFGREEWYGDLAVTAGWQQSWDNYRQAAYFFNKNGSMVVGANSTLEDVNANIDIRASDLGLSTTFSGRAWLCPKYADFIADFDLYTGWDNFAAGLWTELRVPFVHTRWNAGLGTKVHDEGTTTYCTPGPTPDCEYFVSREPGHDEVVFTGECALANALKGAVGFGDAPALTAGKISKCCRKANGLGGIRLTLGYDFFRRERGSLGLAADIAFPALNKPCKNTTNCDWYLFDANIGSQHAWKVGGIFRCQCLLWNKDVHDQRIDFYLDGRVHVGFGGKTTRLLGCKAGGTTLFNHYLLEKRYTVDGDTVTYQGLARAANILKQQVKAYSRIETQITAMVQYNRGGFVGAAGYNFFGRSAERLCLCNCTTSCATGPKSYYVIKGPAAVGADADHDGGFYDKADSNIRETGDVLTPTVANLEKAAFTASDNDYCTATHPRYLSHTFFGSLGYNWSDRRLEPYLGIIGKVDVGQTNTALRLWGIYLKGGICF